MRQGWVSLYMKNKGNKQLGADLALLAITLIWGSTFVAVQDAVSRYPVFAFLAIRFGLATAALLLFFGKRLKNLGWRGLKMGGVIGLFLFLGYALQTLGLQHTSATKAGLITGIQTISVPILTALCSRKVPSKKIWLATGLAFIGLMLTSMQSGFTFEYGDLLVLGCAIAFGAHITAVGLLAPQTDAWALTIVQLAFVAIASAIVTIATGGFPVNIPTQSLGAAAFTGIFATALALGVQNAVSKHTTPTHTGVVFAMEPVFAAIFGYLLLSERLGPRASWGGALILLAIFIAEITDGYRLAKIISYGLNPLFLNVPLLAYVAIHETNSWQEGVRWAALLLLLAVILPVSFLLWQLRRGKISDWHVTRRHERLQASILAMAVSAAGLPILFIWQWSGPLVLLVLFVNALALAVTTLAITIWWKISQHVTGTAATATVLTLFFGPPAAISFLLIPIVAWARVRIQEHTLAQTIGGAIWGTAITLLVFQAFGLMQFGFLVRP